MNCVTERQGLLPRLPGEEDRLFNLDGCDDHANVRRGNVKSIRVDLPLLLPEVSDARDACVHRLQILLSPRRGVTRTHIAEEGGRTVLCVHYDPDILTVDDVRHLAQSAGAEVTEKYGHRVWSLRAIAAEDASRRIENALGGIEGVIAASVSLPAQIVRVEFERARFHPERVEETLRDIGIAPMTKTEPRRSWYGRNRELTWSLTAGILLAGGFTLTRTGAPATLIVAVYAISYAFGAFDLVRHALASLRHARFSFDIDFLMLLAAIGAALLGEWAEGAFLLFLFSLAHSLEHYALGRARASIRALADLGAANCTRSAQ